MRWSVEPPHDPTLDGVRARLPSLLPDAVVHRVLRHRPGRRLDAVVTDGGGECLVVSLCTDPTAAAEAAVVEAWHEAGVGDLVPAWATATSDGRIGLTAWVPGTPLDRLDDGAFVLGAWSAGQTLLRLHRSSARLDGTTLRHEGPVGTVATLAPTIASMIVPTIGGASPARAVVTDGVVQWFDVGSSAVAPALVDVECFVLHLRRRAVAASGCRVARRDLDVVMAAVDAFCDGYGVEVDELSHRATAGGR